jgi:hypothetical protein
MLPLLAAIISRAVCLLVLGNALLRETRVARVLLIVRGVANNVHCSILREVSMRETPIRGCAMGTESLNLKMEPIMRDSGTKIACMGRVLCTMQTEI